MNQLSLFFFSNISKLIWYKPLAQIHLGVPHFSQVFGKWGRAQGMSISISLGCIFEFSRDIIFSLDSSAAENGLSRTT